MTHEPDGPWDEPEPPPDLADGIWDGRSPLKAGQPTTRADKLRLWWISQARLESSMVADKAIEYGATDLLDLGQQLGQTMGRKLTDTEAAELGCFFYLLGKFSRWKSAVSEGRPVSDDTITDIGVYCRMVQRIRQAGGWPGI